MITKLENPTAALYAKTAEVVVRITAKAKTTEQAKAMCDDTAEKFSEILGDNLYARDKDSLAQVVVETLAERKMTVATAESCTGGMLSQTITAISGASDVFECGACTYANRIKHKLLGVKDETLEKYGAVSSETAAEMAQGIRDYAGADIGISVTGIAGPTGGTKEKPVGTVYVGAACADGVYVQKLVLINRTRDTVRASSVQYALDMIRRIAMGAKLNGCEKFALGEAAHFTQDKDVKDV